MRDSFGATGLRVDGREPSTGSNLDPAGAIGRVISRPRPMPCDYSVNATRW